MAHVNCNCCNHDEMQTNHQVNSEEYGEFTSKTDNVNQPVLF